MHTVVHRSKAAAFGAATPCYTCGTPSYRSAGETFTLRRPVEPKRKQAQVAVEVLRVSFGGRLIASILRRLDGIEEQLLAAQGDEQLVPNYLALTPSGQVGTDFSGTIRAHVHPPRGPFALPGGGAARSGAPA
jgi:hypothetical protein